MTSARMLIRGFALAVISCCMLGCPLFGSKPTDLPIGLIVSPEVIDFGADADQLTFTVTFQQTSRDVPPIFVSSGESWIALNACTDAVGGCLASDDPPGNTITIPVAISRNMLNLGDNNGSVIVEATGAAAKTVAIRAVSTLKADFSVDNATPNIGAVVNFTDRTELAPSEGSITAYHWDFGDGSPTADSNTATTTHIYQTPGVFDVTLTVNTASHVQKVTKKSFIKVGGDKPSATFAMRNKREAQATGNMAYTSSVIAYSGDTVEFMDQSAAGAAPITSWAWDFGDNTASSEQNPTHVFTLPGAYSVKLTVTNQYGDNTMVREKAVLVNYRIVPLADFTASNMNPPAYTEVRFTDHSTSFTSPITLWRWDFGDGIVESRTTAEPSPVHMYQTPGTYSVTLTVFNEHGQDSKVLPNLVVREIVAEVNFEADRVKAVTTDEILFTDQSQIGNARPTEWLWDFGDGATDARPNPTHIYGAPGVYSVRLTVNKVYSATVRNMVSVYKATALDEYIRLKDDAFSYSLMRTVQGTVSGQACRMHVLRLYSQRWREEVVNDEAPLPDIEGQSTAEGEGEGEIEGAIEGQVEGQVEGEAVDEANLAPRWKHWVTIYEPTEVKYDTGMVVVSGGSRSSAEPRSLDTMLASIALATKSIVFEIQGIPNEPISFKDEYPKFRTEDEIISYSYDQYINGGDKYWPALLPMVKSVVRGMDMVQQFLGSRSTKSLDINHFVVAGASKRGWTTWLTGAADDRVVGICPMVIDVLNMDEQMAHHRAAYGYWAPAIYPYAQMNVFERFGTPEGQGLMKIVDPFEYRERLTMPKYIINSTGDQFFLPDASRFYFNELPGDNSLNYVPNTDHGLGEDNNPSATQEVLGSLATFYASILNDQPRPRPVWQVDASGTISVSAPNAKVYLWQATAASTTAVPRRDFRYDHAVRWTSKLLAATQSGVYSANVSSPSTGFAGYFLQIKYPSDFGSDYVVTTPVQVTPDIYRSLPTVRKSLGTDRIPLLVLNGSPYEMGRAYGVALAEEIRECVTTVITNAFTLNPTVFSGDRLMEAWEQTKGFAGDDFTEELRGISVGASVAIQDLQRFQMIPVVSSRAGLPLDGSSVAAWGTATATSQALLSKSLDWSLDLGIQNYPCIILYIPEEGVPHVCPTFAGMVGATTGMNLGGVVLGGAEVADPATPLPIAGTHFMPFFRDVLKNTHNARQVSAAFEQVPCIKNNYFIVGDGRFFRVGGKAKSFSGQALSIWTDNDPDDDAYPDVFKNIVYFDGVGSPSRGAAALLETNTGSLTSDKLRDIANRISVPGKNLMNVVYDAADCRLWVSYAKDETDASQREYINLRMATYLP